MVGIHISNDRSGQIVVSSPYDRLLFSKIETINSGKWRPVKKTLEFPKLKRIQY
jgi:hypothetical protein